VTAGAHDDGALDALRRQLSDIDRQLLALAARRRQLSSEIGHIKRARGRATRDFAQEKQVIERARRHAVELGMPEELAEALVARLIRSSLVVQEQQRVAAQGGGEGRRVLVIGGAGRMGGWLVRFLSSQGFAVEVADPAGAPEGIPHRADWREGPLDHDLIAVAAPLRATGAILHELVAFAPTGVVFDVGSLKTPLQSGLAALREAGVRVTSLHPMFGPQADLLAGCHVIFVDVGVADATRVVRELFASTMANPVELDLESHDRVIAFVLGLSHALNIAFFTALAESGEAAPRLQELSSTTFQAQLEVAARVAAENPHLYYEIQALNAFGPGALVALEGAVSRLRALVEAGQEDAFCELMDRGRAYLEGLRARAGDRP
jgi:chorismate mutase/prephenate dehydrogenase